MSKYQDILNYIKLYQEKHKDTDGSVPIPIFEIMLFEYPNKKDNYYGPDTGNISNMGFYYELDIAIRAMNENWCDIQETCYYAGFILCRFPGLYNLVTYDVRMYFIWDKEKDGFFEAEEPEIFKFIAY